MIQWLLAKTEGDNTFWGITKFNTLKNAQQHKGPIYRENEGKVEVLQAFTEGPNTIWVDFDPDSPSIKYLLEVCPPADERTVLRKVKSTYGW